jgi:hypothetical protein
MPKISKIIPSPMIQIIILAALSSHMVMDLVNRALEVKAWKIGAILFDNALNIVKAIIALTRLVAKISAMPERGR